MARRPQQDHQYWSVDSAPAKLTRPLSVWVAPTVLVLFTGVATLLLALVNTEPLATIFPNHDIIFSPYEGTHSIPLRIFIVSFFVAFAAVVGASVPGRFRFFLELTLYYIVVCGMFDLINIIAFRYTGFVYSLHVVEILSGLFGFFIFSAKLLAHGTMPPRAPFVPFAAPGRKLISLLQLVIVVLVAMGLALWINTLDLPIVSDLRGVALLGGTGPGVFLFLPMLFLMLYLAGTIRMIVRHKTRDNPGVTVIIPAHNEAHVLVRTLTSLNRAAAEYGGVVNVLVIDNCSTDHTGLIAIDMFTRLTNINGELVHEPVPGKSNALNRGIDETDTEIVIRIDADTQILPDTIVQAMRHFADPEVGVVGGLPIAPGDGIFDRARDIETLLKHGYYQVAYGAVDVIVGVPGMFAAYRTEAVRAAGGFVGGMNGEDTDMSLRIGEMGFRIIGDPTVRYVSEVPRSFKHLREQRMRWFRSAYHVSSRNRDYLEGWMPSVRGKVILPFMLLNSGRRAMTVPLVIFSALVYGFGFDPENELILAAIFAVMLGAPALMAAFAALANGRVKALIGLPEYFLFRMLRSYMTLESVLSIAFGKTDVSRRDMAREPEENDKMQPVA